MRILQILPHMNIGGVERGVVDLVKYFKDSDIENIVLSAGGRLVEELLKEGIKHYELPVHKKSLSTLLLIPKLKKIIEKEKIDIIHARSRVPAWISFFACRGSNTHFITTAHGVYQNKFWSQIMSWGKFVICPSKIAARHMKENFQTPQEKIVIINRWANSDKFKFLGYREREKSNLIVSVGRISSSKGYSYLLEAFKNILRFNPLLKLKIIGSAGKSKEKYLEYLQSLIQRYNLTHSVELTGFCPNVETILSQARILAAPSIIQESFGRVIVEAMACGVPVVATKVGGFTEIIENDKDGVLVEPANSHALTSGILKILQDSGYAEKLTIEAKNKTLRLYNMSQCLTQTADVYKRTCAFSNILIIKISSLGDLILSFPSFKAVKQKYPNSKLSLLTAKKYAPLLCNCPYLDEVITVEDNYKKSNRILTLSKELRRKSFDYIIDLQNNRASHLISFLSFPRQSFGYSLRWGRLLSKKIKYLRLDCPLTSQERILQLLGVNLEEKKLIFWESNQTNQISLPESKIIGINVCASAKWQSKNWPLKNIIHLIELIYKNIPAFKIVLLGDKSSYETGEKINQMITPRPINLCGKTTLNDLVEVTKKLSVFITPDTATLHLAQSLRIPTIALFGPTAADRHTVQSDNLYIFSKNLACARCYAARCKAQEKNLCMKKITPQEIFNKIKEIIQ